VLKGGLTERIDGDLHLELQAHRSGASEPAERWQATYADADALNADLDRLGGEVASDLVALETESP
jgi:hypothetical protein